MDQVIKSEWTAKLRSGEFEQGRGGLHTHENKLCCLGVLCEIAVKAGIVESYECFYHPTGDKEVLYRGYLPECVKKWAGLESRSVSIKNLGKSLSTINDSGDYNFNEIADIIEGAL